MSSSSEDLINEKFDKIEADLNNILKMYDFAEKLYPYENIRNGEKITEHLERRNQVGLLNYEPSLFIFRNAYFFGFISTLIMSRGYA